MTAPLFNPAGIPDELKALRRWVPMKKPVWSQSAGKWLKIPTVKWSDPSTWRTFDGSFMLFVIGGGYVTFDADHCIDDRGRLEPQVGAFVTLLGTYTEQSMGGEGLHCIATGVRPQGSTDVDLWDGGHLIAITGVRWPNTNPNIEHRQSELEYVFQRSRKSTSNSAENAVYEIPDVVASAIATANCSGSFGRAKHTRRRTKLGSSPNNSLRRFATHRSHGTNHSSIAHSISVTVRASMRPWRSSRRSTRRWRLILTKYTFTPAFPDGHFVSDYIAYASARCDAAYEFHEAVALMLLSMATPDLVLHSRNFPTGCAPISTS